MEKPELEIMKKWKNGEKIFKKGGDMRIFKKKYYIMQSIPGISGFQRWNEREYRVCTGRKAQLHKLDIVKEFRENGRGQFLLEDGHLPEYQAHAKEKEIIPWLDEQRYSTAFILNPEVYDLQTTIKQNKTKEEI